MSGGGGGSASGGVAGGGERVRVAVLGATGAVGQTFVRLLAGHPWFELSEVAASERSAGQRYCDATRWIEGSMPESASSLEVLPCDPSAVTARVVFSALDSAAAGAIEPAFAKAGALVFSNAKNYRMEADVPLVIPEVNASHLGMLAVQRERRGWTGGIVTNANCAATVAALAMAPLESVFGIERAFVTTMQAVSGAGYPGVASLDILGNVIPYIADEEPKIEIELPKMLGRFEAGAFAPAPLRVSAQANRVAVEHGHTVCLSLGLRRRATPAECVAAIESWAVPDEVRALPSSPPRAVAVVDGADRPQPRRDVMTGAGMTVLVGRIRPDPLLDVRLVALGHNTIRGAAGGSLLNAELLAARGWLPA